MSKDKVSDELLKKLAKLDPATTPEPKSFPQDAVIEKPAAYCAKHGVVDRLFSLVSEGEVLSTHCMACASELLQATIGEVKAIQKIVTLQG